MANVDPNVYALNVQLQLDSGDAFKTLDQFGQNVTSIEDQVSSAAQAAIRDIDSVSSSLQSSLNDAVTSSKTLNGSSSDMLDVYEQISTAFDDINISSEEEAETLEKVLDVLKDIEKKGEARLENLLDENVARDDMLTNIRDVQEEIQRKNALHDEELGMVRNETFEWRILRHLIGDATDNLYETVMTVRLLAGAFRNVFDRIAAATEAQEQFVTNNYRIYGSMEGLVQQTRELAAQQGILASESIEAYKALADVRTPIEEIDKYAEQVAMMNRVTGVSITTLAEYSRRLRAAGMDANSSELAFNRIQEAMRKFGASAEAMNRILGDTTVPVSELNVMFGELGAQDFTILQAQLAGFAESVGMSSDIAREQLNLLATDLTANYLLADAAGMEAINSIEDMQKALMNAGDAAAREYKRIQDSDLDAAEKQLELQVISKAMGFASTDAMLLAIRLDELRDNMAADTPFADIMAEAQKSLEDNFTATQRFNRALDDLYDNIKLVFDNFLSFIGMVLIPVVKWLGIITGHISRFLGYLVEFYDMLRNHAILGPFVRGLEEVAGILGALVTIAAFVGVSFTALAGAWGTFMGALTGGGGILAGIGSAIAGLGSAAAGAVTSIFTGIGRALAALGRAIIPVIPSLLAMGAALLMAGAGAYFFAEGVETILQFGWKDAAIGIGMMTASIGLLGLALVGLSVLAMPVIPGLLAISAAALALGAAAWMMGAGLKMAAVAFQMIVDAIGPQSPPLWVKLPMVAQGLITVSGAAIIAAPGLLALSLSFGALSIAAWLLGPPLAMLATALETLSPEMITGFADALLESSWNITKALFVLSPGLAVLPVVAAGVLAGGVTLAIAGAAFVGASAAIGYGAELLGSGLQKLAAGANTLDGVNFLALAKELSAGGLILLASGGAFVAGSGLVGAGALLLGSGLVILSKGAGLIEDLDFESVAEKLYKGSIYIGMISNRLFAGALQLTASSVFILAAGTAIAAGGTALEVGSAGVLEGSKDLYESGEKLYSAGLMLSEAGPYLLAGSSDLVFAGLGLLSASGSLSLAGVTMLPASQMIWTSVRWLDSALQSFVRTIGVLPRITSDGLDSLGDLETFANKLPDISRSLSEASNRFTRPVQQLSISLGNLRSSITSMDGIGEALSGEMAQVSEILNEYAERLEQASARIQAAVEARAMPALSAARDSGIEDIVRSEAVTDVRVMNEAEGADEDHHMVVLEEQSELLRNLNTAVEGATAQDGVGLRDIYDLLAQLLPELADSESGLSNRMTRLS